MSEEPTLCCNCKFVEPLFGITALYMSRCGSPVMAVERKLDYVTGEMRPKDTRPLCSDTNKWGECPGFQQKTPDE